MPVSTYICFRGRSVDRLFVCQLEQELEQEREEEEKLPENNSYSPYFL